jgi:hypothetical protein
MRARPLIDALVGALAILGLCGAMAGAGRRNQNSRRRHRRRADDAARMSKNRRSSLLIAGSGSTDHDGNGPQVKPATLKKLSEQLVARKIATLRYDKRGAGGWKPEFGRPEDFRFKDYVEDAARW